MLIPIPHKVLGNVAITRSGTNWAHAPRYARTGTGRMVGITASMTGLDNAGVSRISPASSKFVALDSLWSCIGRRRSS
jgi:hypothetical protein